MLKHLQTRFKAKRGKGVGRPFPRVSRPTAPVLNTQARQRNTQISSKFSPLIETNFHRLFYALLVT